MRIGGHTVRETHRMSATNGAAASLPPSDEIVPKATRGRQKRAKRPAKPTDCALSPASNGSASRQDQRWATKCAKPSSRAPAAKKGAKVIAIPTALPPLGVGLDHLASSLLFPDEIGTAKSRPQRAKQRAKPRRSSPVAESIGARTKFRTKPKARSSRAPTPSDGQLSADTQGRVAVSEGEVSQPPLSNSPHAETVAQIVQWQKVRMFCIKAQQTCDRSMDSFIAIIEGYHNNLDEKDRKKRFQQAAAFRRSVEKHGAGQDLIDTQTTTARTMLIPVVQANAAARGIYDERRKEAEKQMVALVNTLPIATWAKDVKGLGELSLARMIGEAGIPLGDYRTVSGLWKRFGLAVINGSRQRKMGGVEGMLHAYSPRRRAELWQIGSDSIFRQQWRGRDRALREAIFAHPEASVAAEIVCQKKGIKPTDLKAEDLEALAEPYGIVAEAGPTGPYGEAYALRRAHTEPRIAETEHLPEKVGGYANPEKWTKGRCHNDAARYLTKELVKHAWIKWRELDRQAS